MDELATRLVPIEHREISYAHNRAPAERTPYPSVGQVVFYRHREWDPDVHEAVIVDAQDPNDRSDPWLWHAVKDHHGQQLYDADGPRFVAVTDPWPWVILRTTIDGTERLFHTREARVRGSAGWLPQGWQTRPVRLPHDIPMQPLVPLNVPTSGVS